MTHGIFPQNSGLFNKELFQRHLNFLGSDLFEGRAPGTMGGNLAAKYLALEFDKLKLKPLGNNNTYYQYIPLHSSKPLPTSKLNIQYKDEITHFKLKDDFLLYQTGEPTFIPNSTDLIFVGYGIAAPEYNYNDYRNIDVEDKIVVFIEGEPLSTDSTYFDGYNLTIYSTPEAKQRVALSLGAKGSILIPNPKANKYFDWQTQVQYFSFDNLSLAYTASSSFDIMLNPDAAAILFASSGSTLDEIYNMHLHHQMRSFPLKVKLTFKGEFKQSDFVSSNIIGKLEGKDPELKNSYVLVTAHYDHLGIGPVVKGDSIYNGVFDNAAGVSALLEIARVFSVNNIQNKRSIVFLLLTGEEYGLLGSAFYTQNPAVPLYKSVADINIDGLASFDNFKSIIGVGKEYSTLSELINKTAKEKNLRVASIPPQFIGFGAFAKSDQYSFAKAGIPSILIAEGLDYVNISKEEGLKKMIDFATKIYHTPFDDLTQPINFDAASQHMDFLFSLIQNIANTDKEPEWYNSSPFINVRKLSRVQKK